MGENWYCLIFGEELGPMSWDDLLSMAAHGTLGRREQVRQAPESEWIAAESVPGLFSTGPSTQAPSADTGTQPSAVDDTDFQVDAPRTLASAPPVTDEDADFELASSVGPIHQQESDFDVAGQAHDRVEAVEAHSNELDFDLAAPLPAEPAARKLEDDADFELAPSAVSPPAAPEATAAEADFEVSLPTHVPPVAKDDRNDELTQPGSSTTSSDEGDFELAPKLADAEQQPTLTAETTAPEGRNPAGLSDEAEATEVPYADAAAGLAIPNAPEAAATAPADSGQSHVEISGPPQEAPQPKKPKRKPGAGLSEESQRALRLVAGVFGVIGLAFLGYLGVNALAAMRGADYDEVLAGYDVLFQRAKLARADPSMSADPKAAMEFLAALNKLRQPLRASTPDSADADLAEAGTLLAQMYASAAARPGSPEAREGNVAEHEFLTKIAAVRRKLGR